MAAATASVVRIVWDGVRKNRGRSATLLGTAAFLWIVSLGFVLGGTRLGDKQVTLADVASPMKMTAWTTGFMLILFGQMLSKGHGGGGLIAEYRHNRLLRWLRSPEPTFIDVSGAARDRATRTAEATWVAEPPDVTVIALPVLTALGTAFFGFAFAMTLAEAAAGHHHHVFWQPSVDVLFWAGTLLIMLVTTLGAAGRQSLRAYSWASERAAVAARAQADLEKARLATLQARMNPRFLFNTLNTVAALAGPDSARAELVVEHLSAVLRHSLQRADKPFTSVDDEMRFIREYLDVERERLGARLLVTWDVSPDTALLRVPTMCLLPLIENAIAHAIEPRPAGGRITISSATTAGGYLLRLSVEDDGPGFPVDMKEGRGLLDLRQRLWAEYERKYELDTETLPTGARATISVPAMLFNPAPAATEEVPS